MQAEESTENFSKEMQAWLAVMVVDSRNTMLEEIKNPPPTVPVKPADYVASYRDASAKLLDGDCAGAEAAFLTLAASRQIRARIWCNGRRCFAGWSPVRMRLPPFHRC